MNKRFLPFFFLLTSIGIFLTFKSMGFNENDNPKARHMKILKNVGVLLEDVHYSPLKIDDNFSKNVLKAFVKNLDDEKCIFLKSDVQSFSKFENRIDDEIHGKSDLESFYFINDLYKKRFEEVLGFYKRFLENPIDFNITETIQLDEDKLDFPLTEKDRSERWRKKMKYAVLSKFFDYQEERSKNKDKKDFIFKPDSTLEREARDQVRKQMDRYFSTRKNRETEEENFSQFVNSITGTMDPHTNYFPPIDLRGFNESMSGRFYGIGAQLKDDDGKIKIASLVSGGPAWKSGELKEDDEIIKVGQGKEEPVDVTGYSIPDAVKLIRGAQKGTEVRLTIRKSDGSIKVVSLLRDDIKLEDTFAKSAIINGKNKIGYIYLPEFYADFERPNGARCAVDVAKEIEKLKAESVDGIILDLRGNGGGSLYDVVQMAGLFITDGPICQVKGRDEKPKQMKDYDSKVQYTGPLAVMVDGGSASASEIFAAAIQDYKRGVIIGGSSTYGKGTVQRNIPLNPDNQFILNNNPSDELGSVKLTIQKFYRINGGATQLRGVVPDIIFPDRYDYLKFREKDNPSALRWDEIAKADFKTWNLNVELERVISESNAELSSNPLFTDMKKVIQWIDSNSNKEVSLKLEMYKQEQKEIKAMFKKVDELTKTKDSLQITNLLADLKLMESSQDKDKQEKNRQWIKIRNNDAYIKEAVKVVDKLIGNK